MAANDLADDPKTQSVTLRFIALEGFEESGSHLLGYSRPVVCNGDDGLVSMQGNPDVQVSRVRERLDRVEKQVGEHLEDSALLDERRSGLGVPYLELNSLFCNLLFMESQGGRRQLYQINLSELRVQADKGEASGGEFPKTPQLKVRLVQILSNGGRSIGGNFCQEDEVRERCQPVIDLVHGRTDQSACHGQLVMTS